MRTKTSHQNPAIFTLIVSKLVPTHLREAVDEPIYSLLIFFLFITIVHRSNCYSLYIETIHRLLIIRRQLTNFVCFCNKAQTKIKQDASFFDFKFKNNK